MNNITTLPLTVLEEIGFEGLEGITIEGLWKRLGVRLKLSLPLKDKLKNEVWKFIKSAKCLHLYKLPEEREPLKIFDRTELADPFFGDSVPETCPYNLYKYNPISTQDIRGSCEHFDTREPIEKDSLLDSSVDDIENRYGRYLVIVGSQSLRTSLLLPPTISRDVDLSIANYCILERLARARYNGEIAHGKYSLADIAGDPVAFHNQKKKLVRKNLIKCQSFVTRADAVSTTCLLIHLPRFFSQFKPLHLINMEKIINYLKTKPNCMAEYQDVKRQFDEESQSSLKRLFKLPLFHKIVTTDTKVPYRALYPNATPKEWKYPKKNAERSLNVLQLRDPNVEADQFWDKFVNATTELGDDEESEGFLDESHAVRDTPLVNQLYKHIESTKEKGVSETEAATFLGLSKLNGRAIIRNVTRAAGVDFYTTSQGRQILKRYVAPKYSKKHKQSIQEIIMETENTEAASEETSAMEPSESSAVADSQNDTEVGSAVEIREVEVREVDELGEESHENYFDQMRQTEQEIHKSQIGGDIIVKITEINETQQGLPKRRQLVDHFTDRSKERLKFIQHEVQTKKIFDDPSKILNALKNEEAARGLTDQMCRKTFFRLLTHLCQMKLLKLWRIEFQYQSKHRSLLYVTNRSVDSNYTLMKSYIDQAKTKFQLNIYEEQTRKEGKAMRSGKQKSDRETEDATVLMEKGQKLNTSTTESFNYGFSPKFIRLRTLHEFMFYLAREHRTDTEPLNQEEVVTKLMKNYPDAFDDISELPTIWSPELGWKMFVPPLVVHTGFADGWCLLSDCIFRMPLSIFVKIINIVYEIKGLNEYISHPIKKHFLVKDIPIHLQQMLFSRRKYITVLYELIQRLICIGLAQAGPHRTQKDQSFFYMNVYAKLLDTSSSEPNAYYVTEQDYPEIPYKFNSLEDIYAYWDDMHRICMSTKLNLKPKKNDVTPADRLLPQKFEPYVRAIQPRQAAERDRGELPGDQRGAAGLDSYFFAHIERNWAFNPAKFKPKVRVKVRRTGTESERTNRLVRITRDANMRRHSEGRLTTVPLNKLKMAAIRRRVPIVRKKTIVVKKKKKKRVRNKYDDIDKMALQYMSKLRVDWNEQEDNFLLLCKVAQMYLNPNNKPLVPGQMIRDLIHWHCKSLNKTSTACRRRILYIMKKLPNSDQINVSILTCLNEIKSNKSIAKRFGDNFLQQLKKVYPDECQFERAFKIHFIDLVHTLSCQFYNLTNSFESNTLILPKTLEEFHANYVERDDAAVYDFNTIRYDEPQSADEIKVASIVSLIHSTVCSSYDKTSWSIQLYEIYKDFPEKLLSQAMAKVRSDQMISQSKMSTSNAYSKVQNRCLPLSSSGFHLSATYQQQMTTKISYSLFDDSYSNLKSIFEDVNDYNQPHVLNLSNMVMVFFISELLQLKSYDISIEMPKRVLLLDPAKRMPDESFESIYSRFHEIFNYIPKIGLDDSPLDEMISKLPANEGENSENSTTNDAANIVKKLEKLPPETLHFFCIINQFGATRPRTQIVLSETGHCPFDCIKQLDNPMAHITDNLNTKREVWYRLNVEQFEFEPLPAVVTIDEVNLVAVYNFLVLKGASPSEEQRSSNLDYFKQISDIVDELLLENDKDFIDEDFGAEYDLRSDVKKKIYDGAQINDKIHKFHDFLCVNTCKLSLVPKRDKNSTDAINLQNLNKKRDGILAKIVQDANWSPELRSNKSLMEFLTDIGLDMNEIHIAIDVYNYIEGCGEMGVSGVKLLERYEDKTFLQTLLDRLNEAKFVMKTGVCELTYVHHKHIKPWVINTYHLKRLDREAIEPTTKSILQVSNEPSTSSGQKRKAEGECESTESKRPRADEASENNGNENEMETEQEAMAVDETNENAATPASNDQIENSTIDPVTDPAAEAISKPKPTSNRANRLAEKSIEHGTEIEPNFTPQTKKTFPLRIAPWIRVNGSVNRRVLDKYAGTILLYCIENAGLTLFTLCTRFHYLLPIHVYEIIQYLEEFGCLTKTAITIRKPVTLFSTYESESIEPATDLDDFRCITIEPTVDAISKMSIFIGDRKYKEDFI